MELKPGMSALVTGGASGIGRALSLALGKKGIFVTIVDLSEEKGKEVAHLVEKDNKDLHPDRKFPTSMFIQCDVTNSRGMAAAFDKHLETFGALDICINSAGIQNSIPFPEDKTDGAHSWRHTIDINFVSVVECTHLAIWAMRSVKKPGVIINLGSASGLYPFYGDPIYSGTKGAVVMFTRSLAYFKREGIRINVLCPEFVQTELASKVTPGFIDTMGGFIPMEMVVDGAFELIRDESKSGSCLWITKRRGLEYWPTPTEERKYRLVGVKGRRHLTYGAPSKIEIPSTFEKMSSATTLELHACTNTDWAGGLSFSLVSWQSKKHVVFGFIIEAEDYAVPGMTAEVVWLHCLLLDLCVASSTPTPLLTTGMLFKFAGNPVLSGLDILRVVIISFTTCISLVFCHFQTY